MKDPDTSTDTGSGGSDGEQVIDPAFEASKQTCIATCGLKCKSESSDKKDACIDLCFNQCAASIALVSSKARTKNHITNTSLHLDNFNHS